MSEHARKLLPEETQPTDDELAHELEKIWETPHSLWGWLTTVDHKEIGRRYFGTAMIFLVVGGLEALVMRLQLAGPEKHLLSPEAYNQYFTMHGATMILWYAAPILSGFSSYFVPLLIGSRDMSFPRLNAFSYWMFLLSGLFLYASVFFGTAPDTGWFSYVPLSNIRYDPGHNLDFYPLALILFTISNTAGAVNFVSTIFKHRAPGMTIARMPLFLYSTSTTAALSILAMPALAVGCVFLELDRQFGTHFFATPTGGDAVLWQHLFWFFGHPWVYIVFLPATGMIAGCACARSTIRRCARSGSVCRWSATITRTRRPRMRWAGGGWRRTWSALPSTGTARARRRSRPSSTRSSAATSTSRWYGDRSRGGTPGGSA